jgi:hypothetical protein
LDAELLNKIALALKVPEDVNQNAQILFYNYQDNVLPNRININDTIAGNCNCNEIWEKLERQ